MPKPSYRSRLGAAAGANPTVVKRASGTVSRSGDQAPLPPRPPRTACACPTDRTAARRADAQGDAGVRRTRDGRCAGRVTTLQGNVDALNKAVGEQGAAGQAGATGAGGVAGSAVPPALGSAGAAGSTGAAGAAGSGGAGAAGTAGSAAAAGGAGAAGSTGATGAAGAAGSTGARRRRVGRNDGAAGAAGSSSAAGAAGVGCGGFRRPLRVRPRPPLPALRHQKARALRTRSRPICWPARRPG